MTPTRLGADTTSSDEVGLQPTKWVSSKARQDGPHTSAVTDTFMFLHPYATNVIDSPFIMMKNQRQCVLTVGA